MCQASQEKMASEASEIVPGTNADRKMYTASETVSHTNFAKY